MVSRRKLNALLISLLALTIVQVIRVPQKPQRLTVTKTPSTTGLIGNFREPALLSSSEGATQTMDELNRQYTGLLGHHDMSHYLTMGCSASRQLERDFVDTGGENQKKRVQSWMRNAKIMVDCPNVIDAFKFYHNVPPFVHRIWECDTIPDRYSAALETWISNTAGMFVFLWTNEVRRHFINNTFGSTHLTLYDRIVPGAYRADLFRYVIMYLFGGVYSDMDSHLLQNLSNLINDFEHFVTVVTDLDISRLLNGAILVAPPRQALFLCAFGEVFDHSEKRLMFNSDLDVSGPGVLGECLRHVVGKDDMRFTEGNAMELRTQGFNILRSHLESNGGRHVVMLNESTTLLTLEHGGETYHRDVTPDCDPGEHYSALHAKGTIYQ